MAAPIDYIHPASDPSAKGKEPESEPLYLASLPTDILNLIVPLLIDPKLHATVSSLVEICKDEKPSPLIRMKAIYTELESDKSVFMETVMKCREAMKKVAAYREIIQKDPEFLPHLKHYEVISEFLKFCDRVPVYLKTRDRIMKRQFTPIASSASFTYLDGRVGGLSSGLTLNGCTIAPSFGTLGRRSLFVRVPTDSSDITSGYYRYDFGANRDVALAATGILFVAKEFHLEVYDLKSSIYIGKTKLARATSLYKLDYRFDKITWDDNKMCLIGERNGVVTELRFDSPDAEVQPVADKYSHLSAKIAYVAKRVLKIIVVEGPVKALKGTKVSMKYVYPSAIKTAALFVAGCVGIGLLGVGLLICTLVNPIFAILGFLMVPAGAALATYVFTHLILVPLGAGVIESVTETVKSLKALRNEHIFG